MRRTNVTNQEQIVAQDFTDMQLAVEQGIYDDVLYEMSGRASSVFINDGCKVVPVTGLQVKISAGRGFIYDATIADDDYAKFQPVLAESDITITLDASHPTLSRTDIISVKAARYNSVTENRQVATAGSTYPPTTTTQSVVKKSIDYISYTYTAGTPGGGSPSTPAGYIKIATIVVGAGVVSVSSGNITDDRSTTFITADSVSVTPVGNITSTDAQSALVELQTDIDTNTSGLASFISARNAQFGTEHKSDGTHGPKVTIVQTDSDNALLVQKSNTSAVVCAKIVNQGTGAALQVQQTSTGEGVALHVEKYSTGSYTAVQMDNTGSGVVLEINQFGANDGILINKSNTSIGYGLEVKNSGSSAAVRVSNTGAAEGINVDNSTGTYGVRVYQRTNYEGYRVEKSNTGNQPAIQVFNSGSGAAIQIANNANGKDIDGNSWEVSNAGAGTFATVNSPSGQLGAYVVEDASVSTVTSYNISGLDGDSDLMYKLLISGEYFATAATDLIVAKPNNDTSAASYQSYCRDESCTHGSAFGAGNYDLSTSAGLPLIRAAYAGTMWVMAELTFGGEAGKQRMAICMSSLHSLDNAITLNEHVSSIWHDTSNITSLYVDFGSRNFTGRIQLIKFVK